MGTKPMRFELTSEDIATGKYEGFELIEPLWVSVSIYDGKEKYEADLAPFTVAQRGVFALLWYDAEVCNGGHDQFFSNSTGIVWEDALAGARLVGAEKCAAILERVIAKWGGNIPFDRGERNEMLDKISADPDDPDGCLDIFGEDDSDYYEVNDELYECIAEYAKSHPQEFAFCGEIEVPEDQ